MFCSSVQGVPLGVLHQQVWHRDLADLGKKHQRHKKLTQDKESQRWLIERYHYVLKSGCRLEQLQLETSDRIYRALATLKRILFPQI